MNKNISKRIKDIDVSGIRKIFELAKKIENPIKLNIGLPDFPINKTILKEAEKAMESGKNEYTSTTGIDELREKIAIDLNKTQKLNYTKDNILITSAGTGALSIAISLLLNPEDEIIVMDPSFVVYEPLIIQNYGIPVFVDVDEKFHLDLEKIKKAITKKTKAIIINSPNNPTGRVYKERELKKLAKIAKENDIVIISDEVYKSFIYNNLEHISVSRYYDNTLIVDSFSKTYSLTGWRVGYLAGPKDLIAQAIKIQQFNYVCPPTPFQYACLKAMDLDISKNIKEYEKRAEFIFNKLKDKYEVTKPEGAFYLYVKYPYDSKKFINDCLEQKLLVVPGISFSKVDKYFRISFATSISELNKAIKILRKLVK